MEFFPASTEGTWRDGVDDADAGFIMLANPQVGDGTTRSSHARWRTTGRR